MAIPNWVTLSQNQGGTGTTIVSITAQTYSELVQRVGALTVNTDNAGLSATVSIVQEAREVVNVSVSPSEINIPQTGGTYAFNVVSNGDWTITSYPDWCTLSTTSGTGNQAVTITIPANHSLEDLIDSIIVQTVDNTASIVVTQNKLVPELSISPTSISADTTGGTYYLNVNSNTYWVITAPDWAVLSEYSGFGDSIITIDVVYSTVLERRTGEIIVEDSSFTISRTCSVVQNGNINSGKYLTLKLLSNSGGGTLQFKSAETGAGSGSYLYYSLDGGDSWNEIYLGFGQMKAIGCSEIGVGNEILLKSNNSHFIISASYSTWNIYGNIASLGYGDDFIKDRYVALNYEREFTGLGVIDASKLILPATTLSDGCYTSMFKGCTSLVNAPSLPATTLADGCYGSMFYGCTSLETAPELPATTLAKNCYTSMFSGCTSLETAPELPATTLANNCYGSMFEGCTGLTTAPELPSTTLAGGCYTSMFKGCTSLVNAPSILPATTLTDACYKEMFENCTSLVNAPEISATTLPEASVTNTSCCWRMFMGCTSLVNAPSILPATTSTYECYKEMFYNCTSLVNAPALPATTLGNSCYYSMFENCTSLVNGPSILPATTLPNQCYRKMFYKCTSLVTAPEISATTIVDGYNCQDMFSYCSSLVTAPSILPATTVVQRCYKYMFRNCTSLVKAPELPGTILKAESYYGMFMACNNLNYVKCLATDWVRSSVESWITGVGSTGTFVKKSGVYWSTGASGIPNGWTVEEV